MLTTRTGVIVAFLLSMSVLVVAQDVKSIVFADMNAEGSLVNIMGEGCPILPPGDKCGGGHTAPAKGRTRVVLNAWPADGFMGPFIFKQTGKDSHGLPLGDAVGTPVPVEVKLGAVASKGGPGLVAALAYRLSASWATATANQKAVVDKVINDAGAEAAAVVAK